MASGTSVRDFYKGRSVLVTGGTGFMGKVLVEKLLYSTPDIGNVYLLLRPKRGKSVNQRLEDMQRLPLFDRLKTEKPSQFKKLKALQGDVLFEDFGLSKDDIAKLSNEVSVIFHFAATLKLEAPLKDNVDMNTTGTQRTLNIAKQLKNLVIFVHLSTAFCYPDYTFLDEKVHAPPAKPEDLMRLIEWLDDKQLAVLTPALLGPHPNCYTYSKRLAENVVERAYEEMPVVICRPSIVCPSQAEPIPGWVDSLNGPVGVMLGAGKGVIRTMMCDGSLVAQVIPVDTAINAIIAVGMIEGERKEKSQSESSKRISTRSSGSSIIEDSEEELDSTLGLDIPLKKPRLGVNTKPEVIPVYNLNIGHQKPTTWGEVLQVAKDYARKEPLEWPLWYPDGNITTNKFQHEFKRLFYHLIPAYFIDFLMLLFGQKRFMVRIQDRISQGLYVLQYFTTRNWAFGYTNYDSIQKRLNDEEKVIFNTDLVNADRDEYMRKCVNGGRVFCLKEDPNKIAGNRAYHSFLYVLDWIVKILLWLLILSYAVSWYPPLKALFSYGGPVVRPLPFLGAAVFDGQDV